MADKDIKGQTVHHLETSYSEDIEQTDLKGRYNVHVSDSDARDYVDPTIVITEEENKKLRNKIHKR